jgi:hypothetical protein
MESSVAWYLQCTRSSAFGGKHTVELDMCSSMCVKWCRVALGAMPAWSPAWPWYLQCRRSSAFGGKHNVTLDMCASVATVLRLLPA